MLVKCLELKHTTPREGGSTEVLQIGCGGPHGPPPLTPQSFPCSLILLTNDRSQYIDTDIYSQCSFQSIIGSHTQNLFYTQTTPNLCADPL